MKRERQDRRWSGRLATMGVVVGLLTAQAAAAEVRFFQMQSQRAFLAGTLDGIAVDPLGALALADRAERLADLAEPFLFAAAPHPDGWVLGTGNAGKVLLVRRDGKVETLFSAPEPEVFAVWADDKGTVYAGSSPHGKVYRIRDGAAEPFFDPGEVYIWDLAPLGRDLLVATGTEGKLYRVAPDGTATLHYDSEDLHIRSLAPLPSGEVLAGTAGEGLILEIAAGGGSARTLYDADQPEVVDFVVGGDGNRYAAALASEASFVDLAHRGDDKKEAGDDEGEGSSAVTVTVSGAGAEVSGSRPSGFKGPRSEVLRLSSQGRVESLWRFDDETVYALGWHRGRLWVGTGLEGKLYSFRDGQMVLEKDVDERQLVALLEDRPGPAFATTNAAAFYRVSGSPERRGTFTSPALDAEQIAEFGRLRWEGRMPEGAGLEFSFRSGISAQPDRTWSEWSRPVSGREVALAGVPPGRYVQWRAAFAAADGRSPVLTRVSLSYRQLNLPPRIESFEALDPGEIVVPANFNPSNQVYEPAHPNREGIFTSIAAARRREDVPTKTLWKFGYRTLRWKAEDPNGDALVYELAFRREGESGDWLPVAEELEETSYSFDATVLPDGVYRFRLRALDRAAGADQAALVDEEVGEPVLVDHTPPVVRKVEKRGGELAIEVEDALNPLREAAVSVDAGEWLPAHAGDGILDGRRETLVVTLPEGARLVLLRLTDAAFNGVTLDLSEKSR